MVKVGIPLLCRVIPLKTATVSVSRQCTDVQAGAAVMQQCQAAVDQLALFSSNEDADDIATTGQAMKACAVYMQNMQKRRCPFQIEQQSKAWYLLISLIYMQCTYWSPPALLW